MERAEPLSEGWYLMSVADLERELERLRSPETSLPPSNAERLSVTAALAYRAAGNFPDELDRTLRLVLEVASAEELAHLQVKRLLYEPDFHDAPRWRREGSRPVNVVPLRRPGMEVQAPDTWLEDPQLQALEEEWRATGRVAGMRVPGDYRGFVLKTVLALRSAGREPSPEAVVDSVARWLRAEDVAVLQRALESS